MHVSSWGDADRHDIDNNGNAMAPLRNILGLGAGAQHMATIHSPVHGPALLTAVTQNHPVCRCSHGSEADVLWPICPLVPKKLASF
jgi:hypothetical protein